MQNLISERAAKNRTVKVRSDSSQNIADNEVIR